MSVEYTDDPHPRNTYWEMFGIPMFDLQGCRRRHAGSRSRAGDTFPNHYVKVNAFDSTRGVESLRLSFIVDRPQEEPGFSLVREEGAGPQRALHDCAPTRRERPEGERY